MNRIACCGALTAGRIEHGNLSFSMSLLILILRHSSIDILLFLLDTDVRFKCQDLLSVLGCHLNPFM